MPTPLPIRHFENLHIVLWLLKDSCWLMHFTIGGVVMVIPTLLTAFYIAYQTRHRRMVFLPNIAVCFWITANSYWMLGEFFNYNYKPIGLSLFIGGMIVIVWYFFKYWKLLFYR